MTESLLAGFPVVVELAVAWGEMDSYRHVNNVVYFRYFENARLEYFRRLDWFEYERQTGVGPILAATQARFRKPLTYPDTDLGHGPRRERRGGPLPPGAPRRQQAAGRGRGRGEGHRRDLPPRRAAEGGLAGGAAPTHRGAGSDGAKSVSAHGESPWALGCDRRRNVSRCTAGRYMKKSRGLCANGCVGKVAGPPPSGAA